jgi:hypothetical protein
MHYPSSCLCSFKAKLGNPTPTRFAPKQAAECQHVSSHRLHPPIYFEAQIDKPSPLGFETQTKKLSP